MRTGLWLLALLLAAAAGWGLLRAPEAVPVKAAPDPVPRAAAAAGPASSLPPEALLIERRAEPPSSSTASAPAVPTDLQRLGYEIDMRYYAMNLSDLRQAARQQDPQALVHLAERYLFQLDGRPGPEHDPQMRYRDAARDALQQAFVLGNAHAAAMVSESLLQEQQVLEAAAWNLVARRAGDTLSADWFLRTQDYQRLSAGQREQAAQKAEELWQSLQARKGRGA